MIKYGKIEIPKPNAYVKFGTPQDYINIALYKKPNFLLRWFLMLLGCQVEVEE